MVKPRQYIPDEDAPLLSLAQGGDSDSFETLVWKYLKRIYNLAYLLSGDATVAAEAAKRSFVTAYQEIRSLRSTIRFSSWLVVLMLREYGGLLVFGDLGAAGGGAGPREGVPAGVSPEESPLMRSLRGHLRSLAPEQGVVLVLRYVRGYRLERMVEILQLSEEVILSRLFTAQLQLAALMKQGGAVAGRPGVELSDPHQEIRRSFPAYLDSVITEKEKELIRRHLAECGGCREALAEQEWIAEHLKSLSDLDPPSWLGPAIMEAVRTEILPAPPPLPAYNPFSRGKWTVVVLIVAAVSLFWYLSPRVKNGNGNGGGATAPAPTETAASPAVGEEAPGGGGVAPPPMKSLPRRHEEGAAGRAAPPTREATPVPVMPLPLPAAPAQPQRQTPPAAAPQAAKPVRPRVEMPASLPAEWGDSAVTERIAPRRESVTRIRGGEMSVVLSAGDRELSDSDIERAVTSLGGSISGRGYSNGRDILYTSIDVERVMDLMERLGKIGTIKELPHIPEGVAGNIDLTIRW